MKEITVTLSDEDMSIIIEALDWHLLKHINRHADADKINQTHKKLNNLIPNSWGWAGDKD
jgi:hypothetical protein